MLVFVGCGHPTSHANGQANSPTSSSVCCVRPPAAGQLSLQSYTFRVGGSSGSLSVLMRIAEPKGITPQEVYLDRTRLTVANSKLAIWCGLRSMGTWSASACTVSATFGSVTPAPAAGSVHMLRILENTGVSYEFRLTAGSR